MEPSEKLGSYLTTSRTIINERSLKSTGTLPRAANAARKGADSRIWREWLGELTVKGRGGGEDKQPNGRRGCISRVNKISRRAVR